MTENSQLAAERHVASVKASGYGTFKVRIAGLEDYSYCAYESADRVKAEGVAEFINHMHPETRLGWINAWLSV